MTSEGISQGTTSEGNDITGVRHPRVMTSEGNTECMTSEGTSGVMTSEGNDIRGEYRARGTTQELFGGNKPLPVQPSPHSFSFAVSLSLYLLHKAQLTGEEGGEWIAY